MSLPRQTAKIFETLSKGGFISSNSTDPGMRELYEVVDTSFDELCDYFIHINFILERGDEYFFFARPERKEDMDRKLEQAYRWIDILDFFKAYNSSFGPGTRFTPSAITQQCTVNAELKAKLEGMRKYTGSEDSLPQRVRKLVDLLRKEGFIELESEHLDTWKVLSSIRYMERLIELINIIPEDETAQ
jgi:hypothetical protein